MADDTPAVIEELKKVRNTRYHDRPVPIYGGMVELPLIVTRADGARYFEPDVRAQLTEGKFWVEFDAEQVGSDGARAARRSSEETTPSTPRCAPHSETATGSRVRPVA